MAKTEEGRLPGRRVRLARLSVLLFCVFMGVLFIFLVAVPLLGPCWHLLNGDTVSFDGWKIPVPKRFYVRASQSGPVMWREAFGIPFVDAPYGHITLFRRPPEHVFSFDRDYSGFKDQVNQDASARGYKLISEPTISAGQQNAYCLEFAEPSAGRRSLVRCALDSSTLVIFYEGYSRYVPDLFATVKAMSPEQEKTQ